MINNDLDIERYRIALARDGRVQVPGFLQQSAAQALHDCLQQQVPWSVAERGQPDRLQSDLDAQGEAELMRGAYARAGEGDGFHFVYDRYLILEAMKTGRDTALVLHAVLAFFNSPPFLDFIRHFSGDRSLAMVGAQATRYRPGQFLRRHTDHHATEARRFAYVLNLSKDWEADWGGLLHFTDEAGAPTQSYMPLFNTLSVFRVPADHHVGLVAPWARQPRLAITGWWHTTPA